MAVQPTSEASSMVIRLFGPFEVQVNGQPLGRLRFRKSASVLALLALRQGAPVERRWLGGLLWPDSLDGQMLRNCLSDLRRALGPEVGRLRSPTPQTLALDLSQATVDVLAFDAAIARGDPASLAEAVALRRGPLLEGCTEEWAFQEQQRREPAFLAALEKLAALALEQGRLADVEQHLRLAVATDPLRESAQRALMRLLATSGNAAAALLVYRELRLRLHRELNTEPDAETQTLFQQLRGEARRLAAQGSRGGEGARGGGGDPAGTDRPWTLSGRPLAPSPPLPLAPPDRPADFPPRHSPGALRHNLPAPLTRFIGREREITELKRLLKSTRLLTLTGAGGGGKTRLALQVAAGLREETADGVWLVELASLSEPKLVPHAVAAALGLREEPHRPVTATLADRLRARTLLLVLDNCEHLLPACGGLAEMLLQRCPALRILATSRERLRVAGETAYLVPPLSLPGVQAFRCSGVQGGNADGRADSDSAGPEGLNARTPERLMQSEAALLFLDRAAAARPSFTLTGQNAAAIARVCLQLDGIPLAIELAAARVSALPVQEIAARLDDRFRLLTEGSRTALPRHRTLQALIDWSYDLLSEPEQRLLRRLSVFAGGWTLEAAEAVASDQWLVVSGRDSAVDHAGSGPAGLTTSHHPLTTDVLDRLTSLVEKSLVLFEEREGEGRYRLLETVRQYARDRLQAGTHEVGGGEEEAARDRHGAFCLQLAEAAHAAAGQGQGTEAFERLEPEHDNLRAALAWAFEAVDGGWWLVASPAESGSTVSPPSPELTTNHQPLSTALRLAGALGEFWFEGGYWDEGRAWLEQALAAAPAAEPTVERARALAAAGRLIIYPSFSRADYAGARSRLEESVALYRRLADSRGLVEALSYLSELLQRVRNFAAARKAEEEAVALARSLGDPRLLSMALGQLFLSLVDAWMHLGESFGLAWQIGEESFALARQVGDRGLMAAALQGQGRILQRQGDLAKARQILEESLELARAAKTKHGLSRSLFFLAALLTQQGDTERAKPLWEESFRLSGELGGLLANFALRALIVQAPSWQEALRMVEQAAADYGPDVVRDALRELVIRAPSDEEAVRMIEQAVAKYGLEVVRGTLEALVVRAPSDEEALRRIDWAAREYGPEAAIFPLGALGHAAQERGDYEAAATCYRRSLALRQEVGDTRGLALSLANFAGLAARQQQWERAATLLGAAEGACVELKRTLPVPVPAEYKRAVEGARAALGEAAFAAAWAKGKVMSLEDAERYALEAGAPPAG